MDDNTIEAFENRAAEAERRLAALEAGLQGPLRNKRRHELTQRYSQ
jgi:hypothetical protein